MLFQHVLLTLSAPFVPRKLLFWWFSGECGCEGLAHEHGNHGSGNVRYPKENKKGLLVGSILTYNVKTRSTSVLLDILLGARLPTTREL